MLKSDGSDYKMEMRQKLSHLSEIFALASIGDFSKDVVIPQKEDEFSELYVGVQVMLEVIREKITALKSDKLQIEIEKDQLQTLIDNLPVGVSIIEAPSGKAVLINKKAIELLGKRIDINQENKSFVEYYKVYKEDGSPYPENERPASIALSEKRRSTKSDIIVQHAGGKKLTLRIQSVPVFSNKGKLVSVVSVFEDITKQKELDKLKSQFVSVTSHQLRTPLGTMRWNLEMLLKGDYGYMDPDIEAVIKDLYDSNIRLIRLVNELLNVSRIEDKRDYDEPSTVKINDVLKEAIGLQSQVAEARGITINLNDETDNISLEVDKTKLENILMNLLSNALKYNFDGGIININIKKDETRLIISFEDTGVGITEVDKDKIFAKFYRTEEAVKLNSEGTGLGLFVVKSYVESWGGKVSFTSTQGKGSKFTIKFPLKPKLHLTK